MAGWEDELVVLLRELGVTRDEPEPHLRLIQAPEIARHAERESKLQVQRAHRKFWKHAGVEMDGAGERESLDEQGLMRREVESIVAQVVHLIQHSDLDGALKEDIIVVLRALRRRAHLTRQAALGDIASLEFGLAMLHFCRLVLQLSEGTSGEK